MAATPSAVVIGGGLHGLAAAWHLRRLGSPSVTLVEQFDAGHTRGSSHGSARIFRATYPQPAYVHLMQAARRVGWPHLEHDAGVPLLHPRPGCFFGPPGEEWSAFTKTMRPFPEAAEFLTPADAASRFPQFCFDEANEVIHDRTAGIVAAADTLKALRRVAAESGVRWLGNTRVKAVDILSDPIAVHTSGETLHAEKVVVTAGPWTGSLLPALAPHVRPARQHVGYFAGQEPAWDDLPVWAYIGPGTNNFYYGVPPFGGEGTKAAQHRTSEVADNPDTPMEADDSAVAHLLTVLTRIFRRGPGRLVKAETCYYSNTPTEDFVIDHHPDNPNVVVGAGFSGHGFKFGPVTGLVLAELALFGKPLLPEFVAHRERFRFPRAEA